MEVFLQSRMYIFYLFLVGFISCSLCATLIVDDGETQLKHPTITIGDSIIFRHKHHSDLYIFRTRFAFNLCNFTQSTLLANPNSNSYTWRPSRLGYFYFSFNNNNNNDNDNSCQHGQKLAIKVVRQTTTATSAPLQSPAGEVAAPPPTQGGVTPSSPSFPWPFLPHEKSAGSGSSPAPVSSAMAPMMPDGNGGFLPFINSSPAVPLPASEVDSATIFPLPTSAINHALKQVQMVGWFGVLIYQCIVIAMML